jgi:NAD(P)-dependent dehydrogenase (short-subunit alcohol dehydrogenase family)
VRGVAADVSDPQGMRDLVAGLGEVDVLVNDVGVFDVGVFEEATDDIWRSYLDVNLMSGVRLSRNVLPGMLSRGWGRVIFISSESGIDVPADMVPYGVTKAAVLALGNGLAKPTRGTAVTVNTVVGGPTWSNGVERAVQRVALQHSASVDDLRSAVMAGRPTSLLQRFIEPHEIAHLVTYLASPRSAAVNGAALRVDGGVLPTTT